MLNGIKFDVNQIGFYPLFIVFGAVITIVSIINETTYILLGLLITFYGMIAFLIDLFFDRFFSNRKNCKLTAENVHEVSILGHIIRFLTQLVLIAVLMLILNCKYQFFIFN